MAVNRVHRNLHSNMRDGQTWSYYAPGCKHIQHASDVYLENVTIKQPSGSKFKYCLSGGKRAVFTWFKSKAIRINTAEQPPSNAVRIRFNPRLGHQFFNIDGTRVDYLRRVWLTDTGESWGIV